jgi:hypothetical protein
MSYIPTKDSIITAVNELKGNDPEMAAIVGFRMLARHIGDQELISLAYSLFKEDVTP